MLRIKLKINYTVICRSSNALSPFAVSLSASHMGGRLCIDQGLRTQNAQDRFSQKRPVTCQKATASQRLTENIPSTESLAGRVLTSELWWCTRLWIGSNELSWTKLSVVLVWRHSCEKESSALTKSDIQQQKSLWKGKEIQPCLVWTWTWMCSRTIFETVSFLGTCNLLHQVIKITLSTAITNQPNIIIKSWKSCPWVIPAELHFTCWIRHCCGTRGTTPPSLKLCWQQQKSIQI